MSEEATSEDFTETAEQAESGGDSKQELFGLGEIPADWAIEPLADIAEIIPGNSPPSSTYNEKGEGLPFFQGNSEFGHFHPEADTWCLEPRKEAERNDVLMSIRAPVGDLNIADRNCCIGRGLAALRPESINGLYLFYNLAERRPWLSRLATGSTFKSVTKSDLQLLDIPIPTPEEQHKIATVLYTVDRAIEKTGELIRQSERVRKGITQDIFTTGYYNHSEYSDVRLGPVKTSAPDSWNVKTIPDRFEIIDGDRGKNYPSGSDFSDQGYCLFLSATNVTEEGLRFDETEFITKEKDEELRKGKLKRGDIIMTTRGTVGNFGLYDETVDYDNVRINSGMVILRPKEDVSSVEYYYHLFRSGIFQRQINATSYGTAQPQTSVTDIKKMGILDPGEDEKEQISELVEDINSKIQAQKEYRNQLQAMKHGLMQDLLSGTIRTTDTNLEVPKEITQHG